MPLKSDGLLGLMASSECMMIRALLLPQPIRTFVPVSLDTNGRTKDVTCEIMLSAIAFVVEAVF